MIFGCVFEASPHARYGFGHEILGQRHQHNWAFVSHFWPIFGPFLATSTKWGPNCAADVPVRGEGARARARLVQEHHEHNWDPTFGDFQLN